jgi:hypothetical protein
MPNGIGQTEGSLLDPLAPERKIPSRSLSLLGQLAKEWKRERREKVTLGCTWPNLNSKFELIKLVLKIHKNSLQRF